MTLVSWPREQRRYLIPAYRVERRRWQHTETVTRLSPNPRRHPRDKVRPIVTPFVSVEGHRELLQELIKQGMPPVEYHHGIVQPSPVACPCVHGLCSDGVPETAEAFEDYDIGVDVNTAVLVQDGEAEQV